MSRRRGRCLRRSTCVPKGVIQLAFAIGLLTTPATAQAGLCGNKAPLASAELTSQIDGISTSALSPSGAEVVVGVVTSVVARGGSSIDPSGTAAIGGRLTTAPLWVVDESAAEAIFAAAANGRVLRLDPGWWSNPLDWERDVQRSGCTTDSVGAIAFHPRAQATSAFAGQYASDLLYVGTAYSSTTSGGGSCGGDNVDNKLYAYDASTGTTVWTVNGLGLLDVDIVAGMALDLSGDHLFVSTDSTVGSSQASIWAIDLLNHTVSWSVNADRIRTSPILHEGRLYVATLTGAVKALDTSDGSEIWSVPSSLPYTIDPVLVEQLDGNILILAVDYFGRLRVVRDDGSSGSSVQYVTLPGSVAAVSTPIADNMGHALVGAADGQVYPVDLITGAVGTPLTVDSPTAAVTQLLLEQPGLFATPASFLAGTSEGLLARYCTTLGAPPAVPALGPHGLAALLALLLGAGTLLRQRARR